MENNMTTVVINETGTASLFNARLINRNFSGAPTDFVPKGGVRDFTIRMEEPDVIQALLQMGFPIKAGNINPEHPEGPIPHYLKVKINIGEQNLVALHSSTSHKILTNDTVGLLDNVAMGRVDLVIRPYNWTQPTGASGVSAWVNELHVWMRETELSHLYGDIQYDKPNGAIEPVPVEVAAE